MVRFRIALLGSVGWLLQLLFAGSVVAGVYGVYLAWFGPSLSESDPVHHRIVGTLVMLAAFGVSLLATLAVIVVPAPTPRSRYRSTWLLGVYMAFVPLFLGALALSATLRSIGDWQRSNLSVNGTVDSCYQSGSDTPTNWCYFNWTVAGTRHRQARTTYDLYTDGTPVTLWVDPNTGGADGHSGVEVVSEILATAVGLGLGFTALGACLYQVVDDRRARREWLADQVFWWRAFPKKPPKPVPVPEPEPEIADAVPPGWGEVEDARPPGHE